MKKLVLFLMILLLVPSAYADIIAKNVDLFNLNGMFFDPLPSIEDVFFDPSLGHLTSLQIEITGNLSTYYEACCYDTYGEINEPYTSDGQLIIGSFDVYTSPPFTISGQFYAPAISAGIPFERRLPVLDIDFEHSIEETEPSVLQKFIIPSDYGGSLGGVAIVLSHSVPDTINDDLGIPYFANDHIIDGEVQFTYAYTVTEPATMLLVGSALIGIAGFRRRFRKK